MRRIRPGMAVRASNGYPVGFIVDVHLGAPTGTPLHRRPGFLADLVRSAIGWTQPTATSRLEDALLDLGYLEIATPSGTRFAKATHIAAILGDTVHLTVLARALTGEPTPPD
ncbi:hypothetical protein [Tenggerimyces flavus]|uniref:Uncharacterized protein n=1 Tax=Tenggerimyces flavus TaxID=1708749 RepID=A0ABV7YNX4_9ACTN|nr:hypothetical protein [Tenggerimyces flavus]MBM7790207.1 hypothetical protein [Tenggerimyces flavus]